MPVVDARYDVFLSYDHADTDAVEELANILTVEFSFSVWLDRWLCVPGKSWQQEIEKGLGEAAACAICVGKRTARGWFRNEIERALDRQAGDDHYRVIPILLRDAGIGVHEDFLSGFVRLRTWIDFRSGGRDLRALHLLRHGIQGTPPGPWPSRPARPPNVDTSLDEVKRDLRALAQVSSLLDKNVLIETQRRILSRRFT